MRLFRTLALGASMLVLFGACSTGGGGSKPTVKIGSDGFDEARVVAEVYAQVLENAGYTVDRAGIGAGARKVTAAALESGQIDLKPEYANAFQNRSVARRLTGDTIGAEADQQRFLQLAPRQIGDANRLASGSTR